MPKYFMLVDESAEEPVYEEVELTSLEIPEDHPKLKELSEKEAKARDEAIKARKRYQKLREQLQRDADEGSDSQSEEETEEASEKKTEVVFDPEKLYQEFASRLFNDFEAREAQQKKKKEAVSSVIKEFKLPDKVAPVLEAFSDEPEKLKHAAEILATAGLKFEDGGSGEDSTPEFDPNRVFKKLGLDD